MIRFSHIIIVSLNSDSSQYKPTYLSADYYRGLLLSSSPPLLLELSLAVRVALKLRSLRFHPTRLCRIAVSLIQSDVSLFHIFARLGPSSTNILSRM